MIEIRVPKEILHYKEKLFLGLTLRQILASLAAIVIAVVVYTTTSVFLSDMASWLTLLCAGVPVLFGFYTYNEMPFEKVVEAVITSMFIHPEQRVYASETVYDLILFEMQEERENAKKAARGKKAEKAAGKKADSADSSADNTVHADL